MRNIDKCLIINDGNSALKFSLYNNSLGKRVISGKCINIGKKNSLIKVKTFDKEYKRDIYMKDYEEAVIIIINILLHYGCIKDIEDIKIIGNRIPYGGNYKESVILNEDVLDFIKNHYPNNNSIIMALKKYLPQATQTVSFDASFYENWEKEIIPKSVISNGFHGISYDYVNNKMKSFFQKENVNIIACHLGNTSSVCAIRNGKPIIATMVGILLDNYQLIEENAEAGALNAQTVLDNYKKYISSVIKNFYYELDKKVDAIVFTGGIGENVSTLRKEIIDKLPYYMNVSLKDEVNNNIGENKEASCGVITTSDSNIPVIVLPDNEEIMIFRDINLLNNKAKQLTK